MTSFSKGKVLKHIILKCHVYFLYRVRIVHAYHITIELHCNTFFNLFPCSVQRWFSPYDYQIVQEVHRHDPEDRRMADLVEIGNQLTPEEARSYAIAQLPRELSKHTGFAFDSPGYESFFASQLGIYAPQKPWDVARRASMRSRPRIPKKN